MQNNKNEAVGFSLMQLLGGSKNLDKGASFAQMLEQLGLDPDMLQTQKGSSKFSSLLLNNDNLEEMVSIKTPGVDLKNLKSSDINELMASLNENFDDETSVQQSILKLLQGGEIKSKDMFPQDDLQVINPKLLETFPLPDLKEIISNAKNYLKGQISELAKSKGIEIDIETLPKTLKSLSLVAEKIGVQLDKVTLETIQVKGTTLDTTQKQTSILQMQSKPVEHSTQEFVRLRKEQIPSSITTTAAKESQDIGKNEPLKALLHVPVIDKKEVHKREKQITTIDLLKESSKEKQVATNSLLKEPSKEKQVATNSLLKEPSKEKQVATNSLLKEPSKEVLQPVKNITKTVASTTIQNVVDMAEEVGPILKTSANDSDDKNPLKLSSLLHGEESSQEQKSDIKSDTKAVSTTTVESKNLELDLKVKEAKQMVSRLAVDLKDAVESYKPPFTRIKLQLNPIKLGEVDVTMIQRGNNVHINISSNNSAVAILAQNSVELKTQLANNGLSNATMQFNTSGGEQQRQSQHQQNMMDMYEKYANLQNKENFETLTSMELIVPRYV
ncbi:MAG: flagellar hook-length control protein FliK [Campylobacterota bacterium]|nr:flagellar hook-length control protein FliK [Campylobacterota bacterium]